MFEAVMSIISWGSRRLSWMTCLYRANRLRRLDGSGDQAAPLGATQTCEMRAIACAIEGLPARESTIYLHVRRGAAVDLLVHQLPLSSDLSGEQVENDRKLVICHAENRRYG